MSERDDHDPMEETVRFGKYKGATWHDVVVRDPDYCLWAAENVTRLPDDLRAMLEEAAQWEQQERAEEYGSYGSFFDRD